MEIAHEPASASWISDIQDPTETPFSDAVSPLPSLRGTMHTDTLPASSGAQASLCNIRV